MQAVKHVVIAAAGLGSRLGQGKPKCLVELEGVKILDHLMSQLDGVEDVRIVVGFDENSVISEIQRIRSDVIIVRNPNFRSTTTLHSYALGARYLTGDCLFMDGDLLLERKSFSHFLHSCVPGVPKLAVTKSKTKDAVYAAIEGAHVVGFQREEPTEYEWSNIAWLPVSLFDNIDHTAVYEHLHAFLPIAFGEVISYEVDTQEDLDLALKHIELFNLHNGGELKRRCAETQ